MSDLNFGMISVFILIILDYYVCRVFCRVDESVNDFIIFGSMYNFGNWKEIFEEENFVQDSFLFNSAVNFI